MQTEDVKAKFNQDIPGKFAGEYEQVRWFKNDIQKAGYDMTIAAIKRHALVSAYASCFELGPGHGTWTKELLDFAPQAGYDLLDISWAMLDLARKKLGLRENIDFIEGDFLQYEPVKQYDFFFSARAIEYIPDKEAMAKKIFRLIKSGGRGFVISKTPKYLRNRLLGRPVPDFHSGQIEASSLVKLLKAAGFRNIRIYPVTLSWPFWRSAKTNLFFAKIFCNHPLNFISRIFSESYCVCFEK